MFADFPETGADFDAKFVDEEACWAYLVKTRWPSGFVCPACGSTESWLLTRNRVFECRGCSKQTSVTAGTIFHGTQKPLRLWFKAILYMTTLKTGVSAKALSRLLGLTYKVAWAWGHKLRAALASRAKEPLGGGVEVDEAYVGGHDPFKNGRSHGKKAVVLVAVEDRGVPSGRVRLQVVQDASAASLTPAVKANVAPGSTVRTDLWAGYQRLKKLDLRHLAQRAGCREASKIFPHVHRVISLLKRVLLGTYQGAVSKGHLQAYLDEFVFRFNRRRRRSVAWIARSLLQLAITAAPRPYRSLVMSKAA